MRTSGKALTTMVTMAALLAALALPPASAGGTLPAEAMVTTGGAAPQGACTDILVLSVVGSGESSTETKTATIREAFRDGLDGRRTTTFETLPYPAAATAALGDDFRQLIDFGLPGTSDWNYFASIDRGVELLRARLTLARESCPNQKWALIGYSQGAMVISDVLPEFPDPALYAGVMLLANPSRSVDDRQTNLGTAVPGDGLSFWVPPAGLGRHGVPAALAGVTTDLCDAKDLVCDTSWRFLDLPAAVIGVPWQPTTDVVDLVNDGIAIHTAYEAPALRSLAERAVERALLFAVPTHPTVTSLACNPTGAVTGQVGIKALSEVGADEQVWTVEQALLDGALAGASFTDHGFTKGSFWFSLESGGGFVGLLPPGRWELDITVTTGLEPARTVHLVVHVDTDGSCGGVTGYVTDRDGEPVEGVEVWLEKTTTGWDGESDRRLAMNRTDRFGYFSITGSHTGEHLLFFTDGPAAKTYDEAVADGYVDYFDQYHSTSPATNDSDSPYAGLPVHLGGAALARADQMVVPSGGDRVYVYDQDTSEPVEGIHVSWSGVGGAYSGADGYAFHAGSLDYTSCQSFYDPNRVYVERARYYDGWAGQGSMRMFRGHTISGTVTDENGTPVRGAVVSFDRAQSWDPAHPDQRWGAGSCFGDLGVHESGWMATDANGKYRFSAVYGGVNPFYVRAQVRGVGVVASPFVLPSAWGGSKDVTVNLAVKPLTASTPTVSGTAQVGRTLTVKRGTWTTGTTFTQQWSVNGVVVSGATGTTFKVRPVDVGKRVTVKVTGTKDGYPTTSRTSKLTSAVVKGTLVTARPTISGVVKVGLRLTAHRGTWTAGTTFTYRWYANGEAISGATSVSYRPSKSVRGKSITVRTTGKKAGYVTVTRTSRATVRVG